MCSYTFMQSNRLRLNPAKAEFICLELLYARAKMNLETMATAFHWLETQHVVRYLGVLIYIDEELCFKEHVNCLQ